MTEALPAIRPPQQQRSRASLERVLEAGAKLLEEQGYEGFTLAEVSKRSKVSMGSIYARVGSKQGLIYAIHSRLMEQMRGELERFEPVRWEGVPTTELVRGVIRAFADSMRAHGGLLGVIMHRGAVDATIAARGSEALKDVSDRFAALLLERRDEFGHPDPGLAVDVVFRLLFGALGRQLMYGPTFESRRALDWDTLVAETAEAAVGYLRL